MIMFNFLQFFLSFFFIVSCVFTVIYMFISAFHDRNVWNYRMKNIKEVKKTGLHSGVMTTNKFVFRKIKFDWFNIFKCLRKHVVQTFHRVGWQYVKFIKY